VKLAAVTHQGRDVWQRDVGHLAEVHGFGTSPMLAGDVVCMTNDTEAEEDSEIFAVDRRTGEEVWRQKSGGGKTSYATPCVWEAPGGKSLILMSTMGGGLTAYDPGSGAIAWNVLAHDLPDRCVSSPIVAAGHALVSCGSGNNGKHLIAMKLTSADEPPVESYRLKQSIPNIPTPVVAGELVFLWHDRGMVTCIDGATGKVHWRERIGGNFHSSPLRIGDRIFCISLTGEVVVLAAKAEYELIARHELGEPVVATPAVANNRLLIRTEQSLLCLGGEP
jgi:outer membrane protein assembly factor BamB